MSLSGHEVRAVLFDMDGTLVNAFTPIVHGLNQTLLWLGKEAMSEEAIKRHTGKGGSSIAELFGDRRSEALETYVRFHDEKLLELEPMSGAVELLQWLKSLGIRTGIVTSKGQTRAEQQLSHLGWNGLIDTVYGLTPERRQKPDPHTLLLACEQLAIPARQALMIGDGTADMGAALAAGCLPIGLAHSFSPAELRDQGAQFVFQSLPEVQQWLHQQLTH